jgi:murein DD-endopeptidase MepM/ murein hydrolase activator NlpD
MKDRLSRLAKDRVLITAMSVCILLVTAAALISMYNRNKTPEDPMDFLSENQTTASDSEENGIQQAEGTTEEAESKNLLVRIETLPESTPEPENAGTVQDEQVDAEPVEPATEAAVTEAEQVAQLPETETAEPVSEPEPEAADAPAFQLNYTAEDKMLWPVTGEIIREFSMDTTVWFSTLKQYKCSDAIQIQSVSGTEVAAPANAQILAVGSNEELGYFIEMDLGNGYRAELGQVQEVTVTPGDYVAAGTVIATVASPTYYYTVDGDHLYFKLTCDGELLDPLDYLQ